MGSTLVIGDWETNSKSDSKLIMAFIGAILEPEKIRYKFDGQAVDKSEFKIKNKFLGYMLTELALIDEESELKEFKEKLIRHLSKTSDESKVIADSINNMTLDNFIYIRSNLLIELARSITWDRKYVKFYWEWFYGYL